MRVKILRRCDRNLDHTLSVFGGKEPFAVKVIRINDLKRHN